MRIDGVLFDFDGTLTKPGCIDFTGIKNAIGCPQDHPILEYLDSVEKARKSEYLDVVEAMENEAAVKSLPNHGAVSLLTWLKKKPLPFGVVTRNGLSAIRISLEKFNPVVEEDFGTIITREDTIPKPHPHGPLMAAVRLGIKPEHLLFVGDFRFDIIAGAAAGMITALLTNGNQVQLHKDDPQPRFRVSNLRELQPIIGGFGHRAHLSGSQ